MLDTKYRKGRRLVQERKLIPLGVHVQGAAAERGGAVGSRHPGEQIDSDGSDGPTRVSHVGKTSV